MFAGKGLLRNGDASAAVEQFEAAILADPALVEAHYHLGVAFRELGNREDSSKEFEKANALRERQHTSIAANIQMSQVNSMLESGNTSGAISVLRQVIQAKPQLGGRPNHAGPHPISRRRYLRRVRAICGGGSSRAR